MISSYVQNSRGSCCWLAYNASILKINRNTFSLQDLHVCTFTAAPSKNRFRRWTTDWAIEIFNSYRKSETSFIAFIEGGSAFLVDMKECSDARNQLRFCWVFSSLFFFLISICTLLSVGTAEKAAKTWKIFWIFYNQLVFSLTHSLTLSNDDPFFFYYFISHSAACANPIKLRWEKSTWIRIHRLILFTYTSVFETAQQYQHTHTHKNYRTWIPITKR